MKTYEDFLKYFETLKGVARLPYTKVMENPPDKNYEYRRPFTKEEWEADCKRFTMKTVKLLKKNRLSENPKPLWGNPTKLDLGCGPNTKAGFCGVDQTAFPGVDFVMDLRHKWPWSDGTIEESHSSHFVEHLNAMERVHFFNELWRVMKVGAKATIVTPHWSSCRAYGDPTHQWPPCGEFMWFYLKKDWRMANAPHTDISNLLGGFNCNFECVWGFSLEPGVAMRNQEYQQYAMTYLTEARQDMITTLTKC